MILIPAAPQYWNRAANAKTITIGYRQRCLPPVIFLRRNWPSWLVGQSTPRGSLFVLASVSTADPSGTNGASYLITSTNNKFRCFEGSAWKDCLDGPYSKVRTTNQVATSSNITFQNDSVLFFPMVANGTYEFDAMIPINDSNVTADMKYTFTATGATTISIMNSAYSSATAVILCNIITSGQTCAKTAGNSASGMIQVKGVVVNGGSASTLQFQFAQNTSTAVAFPIVKTGATLNWRRVN
ncbi:hypothetical protein IPG36_06700 [bacterium]|nr:MAG: hypothetical protein IPG36_06700 [bacterium]